MGTDKDEKAMTDETGGKPRPFDKMHAGLMDALEYAKADPMTHVTIPTAALTELLAAAEECADDLFYFLDGEPVDGERGFATVRRLRAAVARVRGE